MQAMRQVGGTMGVAVLGTVLASGYRSQVDTGPLPADLAHTTRDSVAAARRLHDNALGHVVRVAFVHGMDLTLVVSAAVVAIAAVGAAVFLLRRPTRR